MQRIKILVLVICLFSCSSALFAQNLSTTIKTQAMQMGNAVVNNDFNSFVKFMHPNIIEFAGGKEQMKTKMDSAYAAMKRFNIKFKKYWIGNPGEIVTHKNQLQAILPQTTTMLTPMGEVTLETSMIVISSDNGKNWWFIDTNVYKADKLKDVLPDISPKLVIPPQGRPKLGGVKKSQ